MYAGRSHTPAPANGTSFELPFNVTESATTGDPVAVRQYDGKEGSPVIVEISRIYIQTRNDSGASTLNIGVAATNVTSDTIMDGVSVESAPTVYDNIMDGGTNGLTRQLINAGEWFTAYVASGDAVGAQGSIFINIQTMQGGNP